ncbi:acetolactate synthase regulatory subunit, partial [Bradyrhizobium sp. LB14.3]|uniref:hypothetical protein n=1 Tax=Bradyrhizobium sp. LB14.3 TaxID=3156328 RepID=UPI0033917606
MVLDVYFERVVRRRGFHISDNALTAASSAFRSTTVNRLATLTPRIASLADVTLAAPWPMTIRGRL